jgi:hypothetical protein
VVFGLRTMGPEELAAIGRIEVNKTNAHRGFRQGRHESGLEMLTFTAEPVLFMPWLMERFLGAGGRLVRRRLASLEELSGQYKVGTI